jgi:hypothetical protein
LALLASTVKALDRHLRSAAPLEDGAFCLLREGRGADGTRLLATDVLLPPEGAWEARGKGWLRPSARWISAAISRAVQAKAGLLFVHSHPDPEFPLGLSLTDRDAFAALAPVLAPLVDGPFGAVIVHPRGWAAAVWRQGHAENVDRVVAVGRTLRSLSPLPPLRSSPLDERQRRALGRVHDELRNLTLAVVGCGGIGSPLAEQLVRMGVARLLLVDHDRLDTPSNVRRVFGSKVADLQGPAPYKIDPQTRHLRSLGLGVEIEACSEDVRTEPAFRKLLDADLVLCATDTHGSRAVLNDLPSSYLLPVIDVGVRVGSRADGRLTGLAAELRVLTPTTPCLWCRGAISAATIRAENLPEAEWSELQREGYVSGDGGEPAPSVVALTVLASGMATCALLALISEEGDVAPAGYLFDGFYGDAFETEPKAPNQGCRCRRSLGLGDAAAPPFLDPLATPARSEARPLRPSSSS